MAAKTRKTKFATTTAERNSDLKTRTNRELSFSQQLLSKENFTRRGTRSGYHYEGINHVICWEVFTSSTRIVCDLIVESASLTILARSPVTHELFARSMVVFCC